MRFFFNPLTGQVNAGPPREIVYSDTAPQYPQEGSRWFDTINLREYVYTGSEWVESGVGPAGVKGDTGTQGPQGAVGPSGPTGPQGPAATVAVGSVATGDAGTNVSVSNSGTTSAAVLNFTIPRGAIGATGAIGPQGPQGVQGVKGDTGLTGPQGIQGVKGDTGPQGIKGDTGTSVTLKGSVQQVANLPATGNTQGDLWVVSSTGDGYVWSSGAWQNVGPIRGPKGDNGLAGAVGPQGPQGPQGVKGDTGLTGPQGPAGPAPAGTGAVVVNNGVLGTPVGYSSANTANTIVQRDPNGNFLAGTITANLTGNASGSSSSCTGNAATATKLATTRAINVSGDITGTAQNFDGSAAITIPTAISPGVIVDADINSAAAIADTKLATISTANKVSNSATTATSANTANAIVARDANGNFTATTVTAALSGNATSATSAGKLTTARKINGVSFDGSGDITISAAPTAHTHSAVDITSGTLSNSIFPDRLKAASKLITDWNSALENGWFMGNQAANAPDGVLDWWLGYVEAHYDRWVTQTVHRFTVDAPANTEIWRRSSADAGTAIRSWSPWYKLQLSQAEQDARYLIKTGDTMTGQLSAPTLASIQGARNVYLDANYLGTGGAWLWSDQSTDLNIGVANFVPLNFYTDSQVRLSIAEDGTLNTLNNSIIAGAITATTVTAALSGNATSATSAGKLTTARKINGVSFDGSGDITISAAPTSHAHGGITNAGAIGTTAGLPIITGTNGVLQAGAFGTTAGTFSQGNHTHPYSQITDSPYKDGVTVATAVALAAVYSNGTSGVGATLTNSGTLATLVIDGATATAGMRILVKNQATSAQNGVYSVTAIGSATAAWVLTRATDSDSNVELGGAVVSVDRGTSGGKLFSTSFKTTDTVGTTACVWQQIYDQGDGVLLTPWVAKAAAYTAVAGDRISANTTTAAFTITLPASPAAFTEIIFADHYNQWATRNLTISRNGQLIEGLAEDLVCNVAGVQFTMRYEGTTWRVYT